MSIDKKKLKSYDNYMDLIEIETKEEIICAAELEKEIMPEVLSGDALGEYLFEIEKKIRYEAEAGAEYYLVASSGPCGVICVRNQGEVVTIEKAEILKEKRNSVRFERILDILLETYDPPVLRITALAEKTGGFNPEGFELKDDYYIRRYY